MSKTVAIVTLYAGPCGKQGFYNNQSIGMAKAYKQKGYKVYIVDPKPLMKELETNILEEGIILAGVPAKVIGNHSWFALDFLEKWKVDIVHLNADNQIYAAHVMNYCRKRNITLYNYIGTVTSDSDSSIKRIIMKVLSYPGVRLMRKFPTFCKTQGVYEELRRKGIKSLHLAPVGLDTSIIPEVQGTKESIRKQLNLPQDKKIIVFVGRMEDYKRPEDAVEVLKCLGNDYHMVMIGAGVKRDVILDLIREYHLEQQITMIETLPNTEIHKYYKASDCLINMNEKEIFGMCILEAMYQGCVPVARHAPGPDQIIQDEKTGYLCDSLEEICRKIPTVIEGQGIAAAERIRKEFVWTSTVEKILYIMEEK